jgi:hypothetical protein
MGWTPSRPRRRPRPDRSRLNRRCRRKHRHHSGLRSSTNCQDATTRRLRNQENPQRPWRPRVQEPHPASCIPKPHLTFHFSGRYPQWPTASRSAHAESNRREPLRQETLALRGVVVLPTALRGDERTRQDPRADGRPAKGDAGSQARRGLLRALRVLRACVNLATQVILAARQRCKGIGRRARVPLGNTEGIK